MEPVSIILGFSDDLRRPKTEELLQRHAYKKVIEWLNESLEQASAAYEDSYFAALTKELRPIHNPCNPPRTHNSILINGGRGTGKTFFLQNLAHQVAKA